MYWNVYLNNFIVPNHLTEMKLYVKNMVCNRCIMVVKDLFEKMGYLPVNIHLGEVEIKETPSLQELSEINKQLRILGFELIDNSKSRTIEKIKNVIIQLIHNTDTDVKVNYSTYIESKLNKDYTYLSNLFSEIEGTTIEKYIINQKIERVKELLVYDEMTLSEIAYQMGYSSVAYLSNQFKKVTGLTPGHFRQVKENKRKPLDKV